MAPHLPAARALAGLPDAEQHELLLAKLYKTEWREAVLLLFGVLHGQGVKKVDALFTAVLDELGQEAVLADEARCAGMLGSVLRDLTPLHYVPRDPRYQRLMERVLAILDKEKSLEVPIEDTIEAAEALGQAGDPRFAPDRLKDNWVEIPAGEFWMGTQSTDPKGRNYDPEADDEEVPPHLVRLDASFRIGRYPVTVGEYARFVDDEGY